VTPDRHGRHSSNSRTIPPTRTVQTWLFDGWPDVEAVESIDLHETRPPRTELRATLLRPRTS
jgi:hypothetical protein